MVPGEEAPDSLSCSGDIHADDCEDDARKHVQVNRHQPPPLVNRPGHHAAVMHDFVHILGLRSIPKERELEFKQMFAKLVTGTTIGFRVVASPVPLASTPTRGVANSSHLAGARPSGAGPRPSPSGGRPSRGGFRPSPSGDPPMVGVPIPHPLVGGLSLLPLVAPPLVKVLVPHPLVEVFVPHAWLLPPGGVVPEALQLLTLLHPMTLVVPALTV